MKTSTKTGSSIVPSTGAAGEDEGEARKRNQRRAERAQKIAKMMKEGHPLAGAAHAQNNKVNSMEDDLSRERSMLMGILKFVK